MPRAEVIREANAPAARDPETVLAVLTRNQATFSECDLDRHLAKHIRDEGERLEVKAEVLGHCRGAGAARPRDGRGRRALHDTRGTRAGARGAGRWPAVCRGAPGMLAQRARERLASRLAACAPDQRAAFEHAVGAGGLKILEGRAGTGKSYTLAAVREAHVRAGYASSGSRRPTGWRRT